MHLYRLLLLPLLQTYQYNIIYLEMKLSDFILSLIISPLAYGFHFYIINILYNKNYYNLYFILNTCY